MRCSWQVQVGATLDVSVQSVTRQIGAFGKVNNSLKCINKNLKNNNF